MAFPADLQKPPCLVKGWWLSCRSRARTINRKQLFGSIPYGRHCSVSHPSHSSSRCLLQRRRDFLQWMLDACDSADSLAAACSGGLGPSAAPRYNDAPLAGTAPAEKAQKALTEDEIAGQAFLFLIAGYETTTSTLSFATYLLATNPECQEKVLREVDEFSAKHVSMMCWSGALCREQGHVNVSTQEMAQKLSVIGNA